MEITIEIPEENAPFVIELLNNLAFLKIKRSDTKMSVESFREKWKTLSATLPQGEPDISEEEIAEEVKAVRAERIRRENAA